MSGNGFKGGFGAILEDWATLSIIGWLAVTLIGFPEVVIEAGLGVNIGTGAAGMFCCVSVIEVGTFNGLPVRALNAQVTRPRT